MKIFIGILVFCFSSSAFGLEGYELQQCTADLGHIRESFKILTPVQTSLTPFEVSECNAYYGNNPHICLSKKFNKVNWDLNQQKCRNYSKATYHCISGSRHYFGEGTQLNESKFSAVETNCKKVGSISEDICINRNSYVQERLNPAFHLETGFFNQALGQCRGITQGESICQWWTLKEYSGSDKVNYLNKLQGLCNDITRNEYMCIRSKRDFLNPTPRLDQLLLTERGACLNLQPTPGEMDCVHGLGDLSRHFKHLASYNWFEFADGLKSWYNAYSYCRGIQTEVELKCMDASAFSFHNMDSLPSFMSAKKTCLGVSQWCFDQAIRFSESSPLHQFQNRITSCMEAQK